MIDVRYENGMHYTCHDFSKIDFNAFILEGVAQLRVDPFIWHEGLYGKLKRHCVRRGKDLSVKSDKSGQVTVEDLKETACYILECENTNIFIFENGGVAMLKNYDPSSVWFCRPDWEGQDKIKAMKKGNGKKS